MAEMAERKEERKLYEAKAKSKTVLSPPELNVK